jgi:hypothetical protein
VRERELNRVVNVDAKASKEIYYLGCFNAARAKRVAKHAALEAEGRRDSQQKTVGRELSSDADGNSVKWRRAHLCDQVFF